MARPGRLAGGRLRRHRLVRHRADRARAGAGGGRRHPLARRDDRARRRRRDPGGAHPHRRPGQVHAARAARRHLHLARRPHRLRQHDLPAHRAGLRDGGVPRHGGSRAGDRAGQHHGGRRAPMRAAPGRRARRGARVGRGAQGARGGGLHRRDIHLSLRHHEIRAGPRHRRPYGDQRATPLQRPHAAPDLRLAACRGAHGGRLRAGTGGRNLLLRARRQRHALGRLPRHPLPARAPGRGRDRRPHRAGLRTRGGTPRAHRHPGRHVAGAGVLGAPVAGVQLRGSGSRTPLAPSWGGR